MRAAPHVIQNGKLLGLEIKAMCVSESFLSHPHQNVSAVGIEISFSSTAFGRFVHKITEAGSRRNGFWFPLWMLNQAKLPKGEEGECVCVGWGEGGLFWVCWVF